MSPAKLGQHFLIDKHIAEKIVKNFFPVQEGIMEIGPGSGMLTDFLVEYRDPKKNKISAVELDKHSCEIIKTKYTGNLEIINRNILDVNLEEILGSEKINLIGNLPYYISREIIDWVIERREWIKKGIFMMQKDFVDKLIPKGETTGKAARGGDYPRLSVKKKNAQSLMFNYLFAAVKLFDVAPGSFSPPPRVRSSVFLFEKKEAANENNNKIDADHFYRFLKECFRNRRKTLFNNLARVYPAAITRGIFERRKIDSKTRAEQLVLIDFLDVYRAFFNELS